MKFRAWHLFQLSRIIYPLETITSYSICVATFFDCIGLGALNWYFIVLTLMNSLLEFFIEIIIDLEMNMGNYKFLTASSLSGSDMFVVLLLFFYHFSIYKHRLEIWSLYFKTLDYNWSTTLFSLEYYPFTIWNLCYFFIICIFLKIVICSQSWNEVLLLSSLMKLHLI